MVEILSKHEFLSKNKINEDHKHEFGCVMGFFKKGFENPSILSDDIYDDEPGYGLESEPHVTLLFGLHHQELDINALYDVLYQTQLFDVSVNRISSFENDFDVLKWEVEKTEELLNLNELLVTTFPNTQNFPNYEPHITIAYLKKGKAKNYVEELPQTIRKRIDFWIYSMPDGTKMKIVPNVCIEDYVLNHDKNIEDIEDEGVNFVTAKSESVFSKELDGVEKMVVPHGRFVDAYTVVEFRNQLYHSKIKGWMDLDTAIKIVME